VNRVDNLGGRNAMKVSTGHGERADMLTNSLRAIACLVVALAMPSISRAISLEFTFDRDVSVGVRSGELVEVFIGIVLQPGEELAGVQIGFDVIGATVVDFLAPVHRYEFEGNPVEENPWTLVSAFQAGPFSDGLGAQTMNRFIGPLMTSPTYGISEHAAAAGFVPTSAPFGGFVLESQGEAIDLVIPASAPQAVLLFVPEDLTADFMVGDVFNIIPATAPEPAGGVLLLVSVLTGWRMRRVRGH
jgi:hypothetical protein